MKLKELGISTRTTCSASGARDQGSTAAWLAGTLGTFGIGLLVGAGIALLLAPKAGPRAARGPPGQAAPHRPTSSRRDDWQRDRPRVGRTPARPTSWGRGEVARLRVTRRKEATGPIGPLASPLYLRGRSGRAKNGRGPGGLILARRDLHAPGDQDLGGTTGRAAVVSFVLAYVPYHLYARSGLARRSPSAATWRRCGAQP